MAVTHFVDECKLKQIEQEGIAAIEIDLSQFRDATFAALEKALFDDPWCTKWLYHPGLAKEKRALRERIHWLLDAATKNAGAWARERAAREEAEAAARQAEQAARVLAEEKQLMRGARNWRIADALLTKRKAAIALTRFGELRRSKPGRRNKSGIYCCAGSA